MANALIGPGPKRPKFLTPWWAEDNNVYANNDDLVLQVNAEGATKQEDAWLAQAVVKAVNAYYGDTESGTKDARIAELERQIQADDVYIGRQRRLAEKRLLQRQAAQKRAHTAECRVLEAEERAKKAEARIDELEAKLREIIDGPSQYDRPEDIPAGVKAFQDARGYEAVRLGTGWWWVKCGPTSSSVVARYWELYRAKENGHGAPGAVAPLTPIPFPDYMYMDGEA